MLFRSGRFKVAYFGEGEKRRCTVTATLLDGETVDYTSPELGKIPTKNSPLRPPLQVLLWLQRLERPRPRQQRHPSGLLLGPVRAHRRR